MKFRTEIPPLNSDLRIDYKTKIISIGSCFAENIGQRLENDLFKISTNPFGIIFNPISIKNILLGKPINDKHLVNKGNSFVSLDLHSSFNNNSIKGLLDDYTNESNGLINALKTADVLMLTFGSSWVYKFIETESIIANCQKEVATKFSKELLTLDCLKNEYKALVNSLVIDNPNLKIVLTVSPVRHIKDGVIENNRSKSTLILLTDYLKNTFPENVIYFPSYELIMDDLRDYRFYKKDLIHPREIAVDYVYDYFKASFFSEDTLNDLKVVEKYIRFKSHRPMNPTKVEQEDNSKKIDALEVLVNQIIG